MIPIVPHIPHASRVIPDGEWGAIELDDDALEQELLAMTDAWTDQLVHLPDSDNQNGLSAMIEVRRDLYMKESTGEKLENFEVIAQRLKVLAVALASLPTRFFEYADQDDTPACGAGYTKLVW